MFLNFTSTIMGISFTFTIMEAAQDRLLYSGLGGAGLLSSGGLSRLRRGTSLKFLKVL